MLAPLCRRFLTTPPTARVSLNLFVSQYIKIIKKKQKACDVETEESGLSAAPLSPQQLDRIARNKRAAQEKLTSAQTPPGFGESWRKELSAEFGKPYFKQVRGGSAGITLCLLLLWTVVITSHLSHSWWLLFLMRGNATRCTHLLNTCSPGHRCATSEM